MGQGQKKISVRRILNPPPSKKNMEPGSSPRGSEMPKNMASSGRGGLTNGRTEPEGAAVWTPPSAWALGLRRSNRRVPPRPRPGDGWGTGGGGAAGNPVRWPAPPTGKRRSTPPTLSQSQEESGGPLIMHECLPLPWFPRTAGLGGSWAWREKPQPFGLEKGPPPPRGAEGEPAASDRPAGIFEFRTTEKKRPNRTVSPRREPPPPSPVP